MRKSEIKNPKSAIRFLVLDVDGVMTDGGMYYSESGDEFKKFNAKDGLAIRRLSALGIPVGIISNGINKNLIKRRAELLKITHVYVEMKEKFSVLDSWRKKLKLDWSEIAYIGDDVNDIEILKHVGFSACPADAVEKVKKVSKIILKRKGGDACIREFIENYITEIS